MLFSAHKKNIGVAIDIGTASVSAALFELAGHKKKPSVIKTFRRFQKASMQVDSLHFSQSTIDQFTALLQDIKNHSKEVRPEVCSIGLSSIFYLGKTEKLFEKRLSPRVISQSDINSFIEKGGKEIRFELKREDIVVFEKVLMRSLLNGYPVERPIGKIADQLDFWIRYSATSTELFNKLTQATHSIFPSAKIQFSTFPTISWTLMKEIFFPEHSVLLVDIGGELTEVTFIMDGYITEVLTLPFGVINILLRISESEKMELENALGLLKGYTDGALADDVKMRVHATIKKEMKLWEEYFERVWQRAERDIMTDIKMFFLGGGALIHEMQSAVAPPLLHPRITSRFESHIISPDAFRDKFNEYCCIDGPGDFGLVGLMLNVQS
jgi:cell division ATPase FtsA